MGRSAASKLRRKSQREASELRDQSDATLAMEEEELAREEEDEIVFKRRRTVPDTPRASRDGTPAPDEREEGTPAGREGDAAGPDSARTDNGPGTGQFEH